MFQFNRESIYKDILGLQCNSLNGLLMVRRFCEIAVTLDSSARLVRCCREDVSFYSLSDVLEDIKQLYLLMWLKHTRLETPFKGNNVKSVI